ncbi:SRPBCC domain-containing protein [Halobacillus litoralis]|uniref:SRPBCC family protein n=1 Tax=Halobacillus litoralis TaxID=45668 RepID=UPI001CD4916E|nr:SRPBCC domain-containing protein [Halobacillus litoralis]MCA0970470.1 SRPBCC domain-containing protein [Halobacillus litoralis]
MSEYDFAGRLTTQIDGRVLVMEQSFQVPKSLLYRAYSSSDELSVWWGPQGWETENLVFDFRPGGLWHYCMTCTDEDQVDFYGMGSWGRAVFHEIVDQERIVYSDAFSDKDGRIVETMPQMEVVVEFRDEAGEAKLVIQSTFEDEEQLNEVLGMGMMDGYRSQLERLDDHLKEQMRLESQYEEL